MEQLEGISRKIEAFAPRADPRPADRSPAAPKVTAVIDEDRCVSCGLCIDGCPAEALEMNAVVTVDESRCTGCGACVDECPNGAIALFDTARHNAVN